MNAPFKAVVDVAIAGAGVAGLACALGLALRRPDKRVLVLGESSPADQILTLTPASVDFLESLGLDIRGQAQPVRQMRVLSGSELHFDAADAGMTALSWVMPQQHLQEQLERLCRQRGIARIETPVQQVDFSASASARQLELRGDGLLVRTQLAVGADGAQSSLREAAGIACDLYLYPQRALVAQWRVPGAQSDCAYQWFGPHGILALLPMRQGRHCMIWSAPTGASEPASPGAADNLHERLMQMPDSDFIAAFRAVVGPALPADAATPELLTPRRAFPLRRFLPASLIGDRIALMGDAAHVVHPLAGQGLNLGLGDVEDFVAVMAALPPAMDLGDPIVLRRYARARAEPIALMAHLTHALQKGFAERPDPDLAERLWRRAREWGWRGVNRIDPLKQALIRRAAA